MQFYLTSAVVDKGVTPKSYKGERIDTINGAILSDVVSIFIIIATAAAIGGTGPLGSAAQAAQALRPVAGAAAEQLFAFGLLGASLLAASVVPLSTAYAIAETAGVERSLSRKLREAPFFYGLFTAQLVIGAAIALLPGNAVELVVNAQVLNGFITPVLLTYILILANRRSVLGDAANGPRFRVLATVCVAIVGALSAVVLAADRRRVAVTAGGRVVAAQPTSGEDRPPSAPQGAPVVRLAAPSLRGVVRILLVTVACAIALYLAWRVREVIRLVAISLFLSLALLPIVDALDRAQAGAARGHHPRHLRGARRPPWRWSATWWYRAWSRRCISSPTTRRSTRVISVAMATFRHYDDRYHITPKLVQDARRLPQALAHLAGPLKDVTVQAFSFIGQLVTVLALTFLLMLHGRDYVNMGLSLTGARREHHRRLIIEVNKAVAGYMLG